MTIALDAAPSNTSLPLPAALGEADLTAMPSEYLTFRVGSEEYGIDILRVQEIRSYEAPTRIASAPQYIKGVITLRDMVVPIADLRLELGCANAQYDESTVVIVLNVGGRVVGAVVDSVSDVIELRRDEIKPAPKIDLSGGASYITGIGSRRADGRTRLLVLLDIETLMRGDEIGLTQPRRTDGSDSIR